MSSRNWEILGVDHVAIAVMQETFDSWKGVWTKIFGGRVFYDIADANPGGSSSMRLCGIKAGNLSIALIAGIDREEKSQVTKYVERHGDHSIQHIAVAIKNIAAFLDESRERGVGFLGELLQRQDPWGGEIKQIFGYPFDERLPSDEAPFFEFVERPQVGSTFSSGDSFSSDFARDLYHDVEEAAREEHHGVFIPRRILDSLKTSAK
ncbi:MAG: hypothetical protein HY455_01445 [Parcubacteria group bacterium]|nr:hypothetical protein [Parcubacteria group bacterium]